MKNLRKQILLVVCGVAIILTYSCSKDNPLNPTGNCFGGNWVDGYADELQAWSDATTAYSENPTAENCADYKSAAKAYYDAVNDIYDCIPNASRAEIDQAVEEAKAEIDSESCE
ncbi:hypothetical protein [Zobellia alginiliquefaciens]|uniref:hypothetical protein n=1 Tax=Zobellia alginiliquefaciens TaxID=3032586 RepID=UPI0023E3F786|nr:hypothetical protein [Zobellia alginiliquefaciens]